MKTEDLKAQGLTEKQINFVMGENGKDLKTLQEENATLKTEKSQLENDKKVLEKEKNEKEKAYNDLQKNTISKDEYDKKVKEIEDNAKKEHNNYVFDELLKSALKDAKVIQTDNNINAVKGALDLTKITTNKDNKSLIGIKEQLEDLKKSDPHFFTTNVAGNPASEGGTKEGDEGEISSGSNFAKMNNATEQNTEKSQFFN